MRIAFFPSVLLGILFGAIFSLSAICGANDSPLGRTLQIRRRVPESQAPPLSDSAQNFPFRGYDGCDERVIFERLNLDRARTVSVCFLPPSGSWDELGANDLGVVEVECDFTVGAKSLETFFDEEGIGRIEVAAESAMVSLPSDRIETILVWGDLFGGAEDRFSAICNTGATPILLRDRIVPVSDSLQNRFRETERRGEEWERRGIRSASSGDLMGTDDFRFPEDKRGTVVFLVSDDYYNADKTLPIFAEQLADHRSYRTAVIHGMGGADFRPIGRLDSADLLVVFLRRLPIPVGLAEKIRHHLEAGRGLIGLRTTVHGFAPREKINDTLVAWPDFDREVLGGKYGHHGPNEPGTEVCATLTDTARQLFPDWPMESFHSVGSLYAISSLADNVILLQTGTSEEESEPVTWVQFYGENSAKIGYTSLGHPEDFNIPAFRRTLENLVDWACQ